MKLEFYPVEKLKKEILKIVGKHLDLKEYKVFFFGSRVKGVNFPRADIDIGILGKRPIPIEIKFKIEEELEEVPTLYKIDLVDFSQTGLSFQKEALKKMEFIN